MLLSQIHGVDCFSSCILEVYQTQHDPVQIFQSPSMNSQNVLSNSMCTLFQFPLPPFTVSYLKSTCHCADNEPFPSPSSLLQVVHEASSCVCHCCAPYPTVKRLWTTQRPVKSPLLHPYRRTQTTIVTSPQVWGSSCLFPLYLQTTRRKSVEAGRPCGLLLTSVTLNIPKGPVKQKVAFPLFFLL